MSRRAHITVRGCLLSIALAALPLAGAGGLAARERAPDADPAAGRLALLETSDDLIGPVRSALSSSNSTVRSVAARIAGLRGLAAAADDITAALATESDAAAELEEARALLYLKGTAGVDLVLQRPSFRNYRTLLAVGDWLANTHPDNLAPRLGALRRGLGKSEPTLASTVLTVTLTRPDIAAATVRAWLAVASPEAGTTVLNSVRFDLANPDLASLVVESLRSTDGDLRQGVVWGLVDRVIAGASLPGVILDALQEDAQAAGTLTWEAYGREMLSRYRGAATVDRSAYLKTQTDVHHRALGSLATSTRLSGQERDVLRKALGPEFPTSQRPSAPLEQEPESPMRTLPVFWTGFMDSLMRAADCTPPGRTMFGAVRLSYGQDGRASRISVDPSELPPACAKVLTALARLIVADAQHQPSGAGSEMIIVPMDAGYVQCASEAPDADPEPPANPDGRSGRVEGAKQIREVQPRFPPALVRQHAGAFVSATLDISSSGCPRAIRLVRGVHPSLDAAAIQAMSGWRFAPARMDGRPFSYSMTAMMRLGP